MELKEFFIQHPQVAIAFSGGVDSAYLLYAASRYATKVRAYYVKSAFQPQFEQDDAMKLAKQLGVEVEWLTLDVLADEDIRNNPAERCYYCKRKIFGMIMEAACMDGFTVLCDGTNMDDDEGDRPGMKAMKELGVYSPLRMAGLTKHMIRELSKEAGLFTWDKPAYACLATRIPTGTRTEKEMLEKTERAESYLAELGFSDYRVRYMNGSARIMLKDKDIDLLMNRRKDILDTLKKDYEHVLFDLEVR